MRRFGRRRSFFVFNPFYSLTKKGMSQNAVLKMLMKQKMLVKTFINKWFKRKYYFSLYWRA